MTQFFKTARHAWGRAQGLAVFSLCLGAGMVLPLTLVSVGFHTL